MTIEELRKLNNDENYNNTWIKIQRLKGQKPVHYDNAENNLKFWSDFFDCISDEEVKQVLFILMSEYSWYENLGVDSYDEEYIREILKADEEYRLIISPFSIGDNICQDNDTYPMEVDAIIYDKKGVHIKAKRYESMTRYDYREYEFNESKFKDLRLANKDEDCDLIKHIESFDY